MISGQLAGRDIRDPRVLHAMRRVPREDFVPPELSDRAYEDAALPIEHDQTISQPYIVALMTQLLDPPAEGRVLEIGSGSGYQTAVLALLCRWVYAIEWHEGLASLALARLDSLGLTNVTVRHGDGSNGWLEEAPFDAILVAAGAPETPPTLLDQLAEGGRLVLPIGPRDEEQLVRYTRRGDSFQEERFSYVRFVKLLGEQGWHG